MTKKLTIERIAAIRDGGRFTVHADELDELCDLARAGLLLRAEEERKEARRKNCPLCGVANPRYRDGACQTCGEPGK